MIEILFRGKQLSDKEWAYGYPYSDGKKSYIAYESEKDCIIHEVDPDTVEPYIGLHDMNGSKIFRGDIIELPEGFRAVICWCENSAMFVLNFVGANEIFCFDDYCGTECEVIGNIHDTPELIGGDRSD